MFWRFLEVAKTMLFKVALTNMRKNFNQYIVYFVSLIVCVLVFLRLFRYHITR